MLVNIQRIIHLYLFATDYISIQTLSHSSYSIILAQLIVLFIDYDDGRTASVTDMVQYIIARFLYNFSSFFPCIFMKISAFLVFFTPAVFPHYILLWNFPIFVIEFSTCPCILDFCMNHQKGESFISCNAERQWKMTLNLHIAKKLFAVPSYDIFRANNHTDNTSMTASLAPQFHSKAIKSPLQLLQIANILITKLRWFPFWHQHAKRLKVVQVLGQNAVVKYPKNVSAEMSLLLPTIRKLIALVIPASVVIVAIA